MALGGLLSWLLRPAPAKSKIEDKTLDDLKVRCATELNLIESALKRRKYNTLQGYVKMLYKNARKGYTLAADKEPWHRLMDETRGITLELDMKMKSKQNEEQMQDGIKVAIRNARNDLRQAA